MQARLYPLQDGGERVGFVLTAADTDRTHTVTDSSDVDDGQTILQREFDQYPTALVIYDRDGRLLRINDKMAELIASTEDEIRGLHLTEFLKGPTFEEAERRISRVVETGEPDYMEHEDTAPSESRAHPWTVDLFPLKDADGQVCAVSLAVCTTTPSSTIHGNGYNCWARPGLASAPPWTWPEWPGN
ncbi:PAS domain-containing protein [Streptomyces caeruleatus]|uniref:PAS domain-containing protein n=1 Tax=Streptomyces caeruleatus TaxID=661399 RepID=UPI001FC996C8|nr:PAS domain-containing protein [Streptomyces caeruleatus]